MKASFLAILGALSAAACSGEFSNGGNGNGSTPTPDSGVVEEADASNNPTDTTSPARALFDNNVRSVITAACGSGGGCHFSAQPVFLTNNPTDAYDLINNFRDSLFPNYNYEGAALVDRGNGHNGASYDAGDLPAIEAWLAQEKTEAADGGETNASPLAIWSGCMNLDDWKDTGVAPAWSNKQAGGEGRCEACHNRGEEGFLASDGEETVFELVTTRPAFMPSYFTLNAAGTDVVINRARLEKVGLRLAPHEAHGGYSVDGGAMEALQEFYDLTKQRQLAGQCDPPRFP